MVAQGRVQNGVIVLGSDVRLPEGQEVTIFAPNLLQAALPIAALNPHSILDVQPINLGEILGILPTDDLLGEMLEGRS